MSRGLTLAYILSTNIYLGSDTTLVSPGASPVTLTSGGGGGKTLILSATGKRLLSPVKGVVY